MHYTAFGVDFQIVKRKNPARVLDFSVGTVYIHAKTATNMRNFIMPLTEISYPCKFDRSMQPAMLIERIGWVS